MRVYGVVVQDGCLLVSDEWYNGVKYTKLPGGGMEAGEGPADTLHREFMEEIGQEIAVLAPVHVHPEAVVSALKGGRNIVCLYFRAAFRARFSIDEWLRDARFEENMQRLYWVPLESVTEEMFSFPSEKGLAATLRTLEK